MTGYILTTTRGTTYRLNSDGYVLSRTDGPKGWDYAQDWQIVGLARRHHSRWIVPLAFAADGDDYGHGIVHDIDHGTRRAWGNERCRSIVREVQA